VGPGNSPLAIRFLTARIAGGGGNRDGFELRGVLEPGAEIRMAVVDQVDVEIPEARQDGHAFRRDLVVAAWNRQRRDVADLLDPVAANQHDAVPDRRPAGAIDQHAADERHRLRQRGGTRPVLGGDARRTTEDDRCETSEPSGADHVPSWAG
jgi:hypothetical protein